MSVLVAIGVNSEGYREILGICEGAKEDKAGWSAFLKHLKEPWPEGRSADHLGRLHGACRERRGVLSRRGVATLHRALLPQRLQSRALEQGAGGCGDAQGDPCRRGHRGGAARRLCK